MATPLGNPTRMGFPGKPATKPSRSKPAKMQKIPVKMASTTESDISEFEWTAVSDIKVVPIMAQEAASGLTIRWGDVPKSHPPATGGLPHVSPPQARNQSVPHMQWPSATLLPRPIRRPSYHVAAIDADIPVSFAAPPAPAGGKELFVCLADFSIHPYGKLAAAMGPRSFGGIDD
jgi:hypothetical protein